MTAVEIARRAQDADRRVSYRGVKSALVCASCGRTRSTIKVLHMLPDMTRKDYFSPPSLAGTIITQSGSDVWRYSARERVWEKVHSSALARADLNREGAFGNYDVKLIGTEWLAGRECYVIRAVPKHRDDPVHRMWVDKGCYLVLRTRVETARGTVLSSSEFSSIAIDPSDISPSAFAITGKVKGVPVPPRVDFRVEKPSYLPRGYRMVGLSKVKANGHPCAHLQFSNGVNTISLFERKCNEASGAPRVPKKLTTVMTWIRGGMLLTLIGDLPRAELKKIADSTR